MIGTLLSAASLKMRLAVYGVVLLAIVGASAAAGAVVATWRADAANAQSIIQMKDEIQELQAQATKLQSEKNDLAAAIADQNHQVELAKAQTDAAVAVQAEAQKRADEQAELSGTRLSKLEQAVKASANCSQALRSYWEIRK